MADDEMIDHCHREGCENYRVSRSIDSIPMKKPWYCSKRCKEIATLPMHWLEGKGHISACGKRSEKYQPHLITRDREKVTCGNCKDTSAWKLAERKGS